MSRRLLVLCWHNVEPTWAFPGESADRSRRDFARQVNHLRRWANVVPLRSALADLAEGRPLPPRAVALTFDDGYLDNVTVAAPVLHAAGLPATFFLVPGFLSGDVPSWWEELGHGFERATASRLVWNGQHYDLLDPDARRTARESITGSLKELDRQRREDAVVELRARLAADGPMGERLFMDWDEAVRLLDLGHDIQSHTCSHPILSREPDAAQEEELRRSREDLESFFRRPVDVLAYPNGSDGDYTDATRTMARTAGYAFACTLRPAAGRPHDDRWEVPRMVIDPAVQGPRFLKRVLKASLAR